ncbi:TetR family transcriptional regulator [Streptomyces rectiviolaceus]|uniref:HTH tetR-type domain-containing protein n=1 Tax=Streptomyces rectiviolaceus TaxID=332591 RepID=A0ABP6MLY2_9ACTN
MKQERAGRTRRALLRAAASEFDRLGYSGSSLARIARAAEISMGALTFHFASKGELAAAVREDGEAATRALVDHVAARQERPLQSVVSLTLALVELLERNPSVRAAARLAREGSDEQPAWQCLWAPMIGARLREAPAESLPGVDRTAITDMAVHLVCGVEATLCHRCHPDAPGSNVTMLARVWRQALPDVRLPAGADGEAAIAALTADEP